MAILTPLDPDGARRLGVLFGLAVTGARGLLVGSVNTSYELTLASGERVFCRIYEEQGAEAASREAALLDHLATRGVPTPSPLRRAGAPDGAFIASHAGKPVALFPWIEGEMVCTRAVTAEHARQVGEALARVHVAGEGVAIAASPRFEPAPLRRRLEGVLGGPRDGVPDDVARAAERLLARLDALAPTLGAREEHGLVHGDLFRDNVLWRGGRIAALLDFESASRGSRGFDLMVCVLAWCFGDALDLGLARAMAGGYAGVRPLSAGERACLFADGCFAAVRFGATRITDFELRPRGLSVYKDYRRFLARLDALEALGAAGLAWALGL
jgi:homoserine kinase type II